MAADDIAICNRAIIQVKGNTITTLAAPGGGATDSVERIACDANYDDALDEALAGAEWPFAIGRATIAKDASAPEFEYAARYPVPADTIRILECFPSSDYNDGNQALWVQEEQFILTEEAHDNLYVRYIKRITDTTKFSPAFTAAFVMCLATYLARPVTGSASIAKQIQDLYDMKLAEAANIDGLVGRSRRFRSRHLTGSRTGGGEGFYTFGP